MKQIPGVPFTRREPDEASADYPENLPRAAQTRPQSAGSAGLSGTDMDASQIAESMIATWRAVAAALAPIIGPRGVDALYQRSLKLSSRHHPWLSGIAEAVSPSMDLEALRAALARQNAADTAVAGRDVLHNFHELLTTLIGPALTERLLASVWEDSVCGPPLQEAIA